MRDLQLEQPVLRRLPLDVEADEEVRDEPVARPRRQLVDLFARRLGNHPGEKTVYFDDRAHAALAGVARHPPLDGVVLAAPVVAG